jgi:hypothetical protein
MARVKRLSTVSPLSWIPDASEARIRSIMPAMALPTGVSGPPRQAPGIGLAGAAWAAGAAWVTCPTKVLRCNWARAFGAAVFAGAAGAAVFTGVAVGRVSA